MHASVADLLLQEKPARILLLLWEEEETYISEVAKKVETTFAHASKVISEMEGFDLVELHTRGRAKYVRLTDFGEMVSRMLHEFIHAMKNPILMKDLYDLTQKLHKIEKSIDSDTGRYDQYRLARQVRGCQEDINRLIELKVVDKVISENIARLEIEVDRLIEKFLPGN